MRNEKYKKVVVLASLVAAFLMSSCNKNESYADLLNKERHAANAYLANCRVVNEIPKDTVFEVGNDAPYYRLDY